MNALWNAPISDRFSSLCARVFSPGKALDIIDLNQMSHRYVSGVLQNDWNDPVDFRSLDRSQRRCYIWVSLSYKTVNTVVSSLYHWENVKSVIDSAVLHWTTRLMGFPRNAGLGRCYLVSTRNEILSNIDRNLTVTQQLICIFHTRLQYRNHVCRPSLFFKFTVTNRF